MKGGGDAGGITQGVYACVEHQVIVSGSPKLRYDILKPDPKIDPSSLSLSSYLSLSVCLSSLNNHPCHLSSPHVFDVTHPVVIHLSSTQISIHISPRFVDIIFSKTD